MSALCFAHTTLVHASDTLAKADDIIVDVNDEILLRNASDLDGALKLDHIGIAVRSIDAARALYALLGIAVSHEETVEREQVRTAMLPLGDMRIELLEPMRENSAVGRFLARRGEGLHHIAVRVQDIDRVFARLCGEGVRLVGDNIGVGAGGHRYFFIHPQSSGGVLVEVVGDADLQERPR